MERDRGYEGFVALGALLLTLLGIWLWISMLIGPYRFASGMLDARTHLRKARNVLTAGDLEEARFRVLAGAAAAERAEDGLESSGPLFDIALASSSAADLIGELPLLVEGLGHSADAAVGTLELVQNTLRGPDAVIAEDPEDPEGSIIRLERIEELGAVVSDIRGSVQAAAATLGKVDLKALPKRLRPDVEDAITQATDADDSLADVETGFELLPRLLGSEGPRRYLIAMQNSAELRGTGGAILRFTELEIDDGRPQIGQGEEATKTVYEIDENREPLSIPLPDDAWYVREISDAQRFGNANWSPDWPLSAQVSIAYGQASAETFGVDFPEVHGVFLVDPVAMKNLVPGVGAFKTERFRNKIRSQAVVYFLLNKYYGAYPNKELRRKALSDVVDTFYDKILRPSHPTLLLQGFSKTLRTKHMQMWLADPREQAFIEHMDWDGSIRDARDSDYLYVVEQNVGGNKLDYFAEQTDEVDVRFDGRDALVSTSVNITNGVFFPQPRYVTGDSDGVHKPMINVYAPGDAILEDQAAPVTCTGEQTQNPDLFAAPWEAVCRSNLPSPSAWTGDSPPVHQELGKTVWSAALQIPPSQEGSLTFDYRSPGVVRTEGGRSFYRLVVQRQPKPNPQTLVVRLHLPSGASDVKAPGFEEEDGALVWERPLTQDLVLEVSWRT